MKLIWTRAALFAVCVPLGVSAQQSDRPELEIANPSATFPAQQRALPPPALIARGDGLYQVNCQACHGADLRGGDQGGPNLLRSDIVLNDVAGETIGPIIRQGSNRMPANTSLGDEAIEAIAGYIHSVVARSERQGAPPRVEYELDILVGDVEAGQAFFNRECTGCHSAAGDLAGIGSRIEDPVTLQNGWVAGRIQRRFGAAADGGAGVTRVTVTPGDVPPVTGELLRYYDFYVSLRTDEGEYRSFTRRGNRPSVRIEDPLWRHRELLAELDDETMHDVTAYLESLK
jgi:cytochrome c oxidase cbb3-type subunit 3